MKRQAKPGIRDMFMPMTDPTSHNRRKTTGHAILYVLSNCAGSHGSARAQSTLHAMQAPLWRVMW